MNTKTLLAGLLSLAAIVLPVSCADTVADTPSAIVQPASGKVGAALAALPVFNGAEANVSARYYIYLSSAGWCGPCNREMPSVVEAYKDMKASGLVELILVDFDRTPEAAAAYVAKYGANFPAIMAEHAASLPGYESPRGIPSAILVDAQGKVLRKGHGSMVTKWRELISAVENASSEPAQQTLTLTPSSVRLPLASVDDEDDEKGKKKEKGERGVVGDVCRRIRWSHGKPNLKAKYYIYIRMEDPVYEYYSGRLSLSSYVRDDMPLIVKFTREMKKDGRVDCVILTDMEHRLNKFLVKESKFKGAVGSFSEDEQIMSLPGFVDLSQYSMQAVFVRGADGKVIKKGGAHDIVGKWRENLMEAEDSGN